MNQLSDHRVTKSEKYSVYLMAFSLLIVMILIILFSISQQKRLNEYSEWYCQEVYGLDKDCKTR